MPQVTNLDYCCICICCIMPSNKLIQIYTILRLLLYCPHINALSGSVSLVSFDQIFLRHLRLNYIIIRGIKNTHICLTLYECKLLKKKLFRSIINFLDKTKLFLTDAKRNFVSQSPCLLNYYNKIVLLDRKKRG